MTNGREFDKSGVYAIRVKGSLDPQWSDRFYGFNITAENGEAVLLGMVADQAALHGILNRIRDTGLPLLSVNRVTEE
jgi:hypothetical protein